MNIITWHHGLIPFTVAFISLCLMLRWIVRLNEAEMRRERALRRATETHEQRVQSEAYWRDWCNRNDMPQSTRIALMDDVGRR